MIPARPRPDAIEVLCYPAVSRPRRIVLRSGSTICRRLCDPDHDVPSATRLPQPDHRIGHRPAGIPEEGNRSTVDHALLDRSSSDGRTSSAPHRARLRRRGDRQISTEANPHGVSRRWRAGARLSHQTGLSQRAAARGAHGRRILASRGSVASSDDGDGESLASPRDAAAVAAVVASRAARRGGRAAGRSLTGAVYRLPGSTNAARRRATPRCRPAA